MWRATNVIETYALNKRYGAHIAARDLDFQVNAAIATIALKRRDVIG